MTAPVGVAGPGSDAAAAGGGAGRAASAPIRLLFLVADTGGGHRASAEAVGRRLLRSHPGRFETCVLDPFVETSPRPVGAVVGLYSPMIRRTPWLWGALFHLTNSRPAVGALRGSALRLVEPGLADAVAALRPAVIVSFHPLLNHVATRVVRRLPGRRVPVLTVVTDLVDIHAAWMSAGVDAVVTPSPLSLDRCRRAGIPAGQCFDLGLPVDERFSQSPPAGVARAALRRRLGLPEQGTVVLLAGGGEGSGGLGRRARALLDARVDAHVAVICGRNVRLRRRLEALADGSGRLTVRGFVDDMPDWLHAADMLVTKAGPGTIAEALCCRVPLLLTTHVPGQESGNVEYVVANGAGRHVPRVRDLVEAVQELSQPGSPALGGMREAMRRAGRPQATAAIADLVARCALEAVGAEAPAASPPGP